jgi:hypothetical protein
MGSKQPPGEFRAGIPADDLFTWHSQPRWCNGTQQLGAAHRHQRTLTPETVIGRLRYQLHSASTAPAAEPAGHIPPSVITIGVSAIQNP